MLLESQFQDWSKYVSGDPMLRAAVEVLAVLSEHGKAYIVGGAVRDIILGNEPHDVDIATNVPMEKIEELFKAHDIGKNKTFGIVVIEHRGYQFEVAQFRSDGEYLDGRRPETIEIVPDFKDDAVRRDFTINAMAIDKDGNILDYFDGQKDIKNRVLKTVGDPEKRFSEDYLRILRSVRLSNRLDFEIDPQTKEAMKAGSSKVKDLSVERVTQELVKMASQSGTKFARAIRTLYETGILQYILPEVVKMEEFEHDPETHPEGGVLEHTLKALEQNDVADPIINLALLLHDIGKIKTYKKEGAKISYLGHAKEGVELIEEIAKRLKLDNETKEALVFAAENHMKIHDLLQMSNSKVVSLMNNKNWNVLFNVAKCDASCRKQMFDAAEWTKIVEKVDMLSKKYKNEDVKKQIKKVVDGKWVMELLGLKPGKAVGEAINKTMSWILDNNIDINDVEKIKTYILAQKI
jgi:tRNA nucleotidyltransferase/poly(A) polymerase